MTQMEYLKKLLMLAGSNKATSHLQDLCFTPGEPVWPLPRKLNGLTNDEIRTAFSQYAQWHYAFQFSGNLTFPVIHADGHEPDPARPLKRFKHFMPTVLGSDGQGLQGKRVLDIACNSGFWSIQCALWGAKEVIGFDARPELISQANLIKSIVGVKNVHFQTLNFWDMSPQNLGGKFDVVLSLGILYHLPKTFEALEKTLTMAKKQILLDTTVHPTSEAQVVFHQENARDIRMAASGGLVAIPSKTAVELMLQYFGVTSFAEIPIINPDTPQDYVSNLRAAWIIEK